MALSFSNDTTSMHNHVMYLWILCVFWMNGCSFILSNRKRHYTQFCLLRDHLNNVGSYIIISFIHYWLVEWFCSYYRGITLHYMKPLIYRAGFGTTLCVFSKEEAIISRAEIHSSVSYQTKTGISPFLLNFPNDLVNKSLLRNKAASIATYQGICVTPIAKCATKPEEIKRASTNP